ncbi:MAG: protein kinase [Sandaracinaceae bacterium]
MDSSASRDARELEALSTVWRAHGLSVNALDERPDGTLSASDRQLTLAAEDAAPAHSAALVREPLVIGEPLGRGGMGVVESATQLALRREVAVKRVREGAGPRAMQNLLKEAWIGGALQHPNIVPVHALANLDGEPAVVMKRIEGETWRSRMRRARESAPDTHAADTAIAITA